MTCWHAKNLGDASLADASLAAIAEHFDAAPELPDHAAIFFRHQSDGQLHCDLVVYFSPAAAVVAAAFGAARCPKPARAGLGLLAGAPAAWSACFPDERG